MDDPAEAEYLARNNMLILKEMSALKEILFRDEVARSCSQADTTTRSLPSNGSVPRRARSSSQALNRTQPIRQIGTSKESRSTSQEHASRSLRPTAILEALPESPRKTPSESNGTPSPTKQAIASPAVMQVELSNEEHSSSLQNAPGPSSTETVPKIEETWKEATNFGGKPRERKEQTSPRKVTPIVTQQPKTSQRLEAVLMDPSTVEVGNQQVLENESQHKTLNPVARRLSTLEALVIGNETNASHNMGSNARAPDPVIFNSPRKADSPSAAPTPVTSKPQIPLQRQFNSERIPVQHREVRSAGYRPMPPPEETTKTTPAARQTRCEFRNDQTEESRSDPDCERLPNNESAWERRIQGTPLFEPFGNPNQQAEQSTWVDESAAYLLPQASTYSNQLSPNDAVIAPFVDQSEHSIQTTRPAPREYPDMFTAFRRQLAEEDRNKERQERSRISLEMTTDFVGGFGFNQQLQNIQPAVTRPQGYDDATRPSTSMSRRGMLLPPQSKGRKKSESERRSVSVHSVPSAQASRNRQFYNSQSNISATNFDQFPQGQTAVSTEQKYEEVVPLDIDLASLTSEALDGKTEEELQQIVNAFYESGPRLKFKETYPYMAEGMVQKDGQTSMLKVFSSRLGRALISDERSNKAADYVYFLVVRPGEFRGFWYDTHPRCLISAKFPSVERIVVRGYAILAHPNSRADSLKESRWICWNDSLGLMPIISGSARIPLKKQPVWDKQLDVISIHANFENNKFVVTKVVALTNSGEKKQQFPGEVFLIRDPVYVNTVEDDIIFSSNTLKADIHIKRTLVGEAEFHDGTPFELVVVPTFPKSTTMQFRALLLINMPSTFWSRDKEWIREILVKKTESYRS